MRVVQIQEIHRQYLEEGKGRRDVMIVAHGHFSRVLISRWVQFPLCLGTHFNVEPAGVRALIHFDDGRLTSLLHEDHDPELQSS